MIRATQLLLSSCILLFVGCKATDSQLQQVNKNWNKLVRANHIYPVYPLSQDIQPGDIFLVSQDIEDLTVWDSDGYLKLDRLIGRLSPKNYSEFYGQFTQGEINNHVPGSWLRDNQWTNAPQAAFPSYTFTVREGSGIDVALPIQGIPVGLGLMQTKVASGYVTIGDAFTYGIDELSLQTEVKKFIADHDAELISLLPETGSSSTNYLQAVTRVYLTGKVTVSMFNDSGTGLGAFGGAPKNVELPLFEQTNNTANYTNLVNAVNGVVGTSTATKAAANVLPGGTLKFSFVSSRSLAMEETFPKPLVIGYLAFTVPLIRDRNKAAAPPGTPELTIGRIETIGQTLNRLRA